MYRSPDTQHMDTLDASDRKDIINEFETIDHCKVMGGIQVEKELASG